MEYLHIHLYSLNPAVPLISVKPLSLFLVIDLVFQPANSDLINLAAGSCRQQTILINQLAKHQTAHKIRK